MAGAGWDVIVVGSGPAGAATALRLAAVAPAVAGRTLVLEKARHPRPKTCAGGVIPKATALLGELGVSLDVPHVRVGEARVDVPGARVAATASDLCRIVRRADFDARLAWAARDRGVTLREGVRVLGLIREEGGVRVETDAGTHRARVVVGADGSGSRVRRALVDGGAPARLARAVMCDVPASALRWDGHAAAHYDFDFRGCPRGLRGYGWVFPCVVDGEPYANVGIYGLPPADGALLDAELRRLLVELGADEHARRQAFPIRTWVPGTAVAAPRALLVGDAAGVDPLMGEGISFALEYGMLAADAVVRALAVGDFGFADHAAAVRGGPLGRKLDLLDGFARRFYGPQGWLWFRLTRLSRRARRAGLDWYNGVEVVPGAAGRLVRRGGRAWLARAALAGAS
jgi:geranylgeranyl reductase family protein